MKKVLLCGIKGTGMSTLALILQRIGYEVLGLDKSIYFSTEEKLKNNEIKYYENFELTNLTDDIDLFIYSSAYEKLDLVRMAKQRYKSYSYPEYLGYLSTKSQTYAICGTHGKSSTAALSSYALSQGNRKNFSFYSIYGSNIIGESDITYQGSENLILEACEYQDHFLLYQLNGLVITNIEYDHPDYFKDINQMIESYKKLIKNIKIGGFLIINNDNYNNKKILKYVQLTRYDLIVITYGFQKNSTIAIEEGYKKGYIKIPFMGNQEYNIPTLNRSLIGNYVAASILSACVILDRDAPKLYLDNYTIIFEEVINTLLAQSLKVLQDFIGISRRLELRGIVNGLLFFDDYAHHPTELETVINELHLRYPGKRIISIFTPHTASRTKALFQDFANVLCDFDVLILTPTFNARDDNSITDYSQLMYEKIRKQVEDNNSNKLSAIYYLEKDNEIIDTCLLNISCNDIIITLGAANKTYLVDEIARIING
ncbi:MAG: hypothetical protein JJE21_08190 [Spirochaetaceae bacterium]|nr:hypothetical protein [Spirochaetaceae bacterium]